jgi:CheY-like chemotaxis protein
MIRTRFKKVLLVAPDFFPEQLLADFKEIKRTATVTCIFPSLYEFNPDLIIFDYDYIGKDVEKVLRRIRNNKFYNKLKICCFKSAPNEKTDSLLKALGADQLIYQEDLVKHQKNKNILSHLGTALDTSILKRMGTVSN